MKRSTLFAVIGVGSIVVLLAAYKIISIMMAIMGSASFGPPPEAITATIAKEEIWQKKVNAIGTLKAVQGVTISAQEGGAVSKIGFESGASVNEGDLLVEIDTSVEEAQLKGALAWESRMKKAYDRATALRANNAISIDELDKTSAEYQKAVSEVESLRATIAKKRITAPFSGKTGIRSVNIGEYVSPGKEIVPLYSLKSLFVNFSLPQQAIAKIAVGQPVALSVDAFPSEQFTGKINALNPNITDSNRTVEVQATIANERELLRPGMFVNVSVTLPDETKVIALPITSINYAPYGDSVYIIEKMKDPKDSSKEYEGVRQQFVQVGPKQGDQIAVLSGIKPGERIATSGLFKLRPGAAVSINDKLLPSDDKAPKPEDT